MSRPAPLVLTVGTRAAQRLLVKVVLVMGAITVPFTLAEYRLSEISWSAAALARRFTLDSEAAIPAWFATLLLVGAAVLLGLIAAHARATADGWWRHWAGLSALFVALSIDEAAGFHELLIIPVRTLVDGGGLLYFAWVIPGAVFVVAVAAFFRRFVWSLPRRTRNGVLLAGGIFVGGALGVELVEGLLIESYGEAHLAYILAATVEELAEMLGMVLFLQVLTAHLAARVGEIRVRLQAAGPLATATAPAVVAGADAADDPIRTRRAA